MRGRQRTIASLLAETLARKGPRGPASAAAFAEAVGWPLSREARLRAHTRDGRIIVEARSGAWADQLEALAGAICDKMNARLGEGAVTAVEVRRPPSGRP
ncbi:DciA family protein [Anaeromyxobacter paludicola]|uniref:DUF721 domain-containing protein n=1 Tax=Anaeromyxobacter paludicola TaxID=2918171 RepID=A0ABN6N3H5_9BACT|nr:DciA family protein [Anaeromyxobacter paludicola]BDG07751.1 hypothetical protein AMPC_08640 [Anaeromyxobacter paludicola]